MRADAQRNRHSLLDAARDVFVEQGPGASLEEIARRSGVGIATLYRHFGDRATLMHAVVLTAITAGGDAADRALREHADPFDALAAYVHAVIDLRISAVIPTLLGQLDLDERRLDEARTKAAALVQQVIDNARRAGALRAGITFGDIGLLLTRLSRPLPGPIPPSTQVALAHRHADIVLAGLRQAPTAGSLTGPEIERADLHQFRAGR